VPLWLESHAELRDHPKTAALRRRLGITRPAAIGHLHLLWWWAMTYAVDGDLSGYDADVIADAADWMDDPGVFLRALVAAGFLDDDLRIHDWDDYAGRLIERREANAERMRQARDERRARLKHGPSAAEGNGPGFAHGMPDLSRTSGARPAHVQGLPDLNRTIPVPDRTGPDLPPNPPPQAEGGTDIQTRRKRRRQLSEPEPAEIPELAPLSDADLAVLHRACERLKSEMSETNWETLVGALEPMGRADDGTLHLRAPPGRYAARVQGHLARALVDAGDRSGHVAIVEQ
jgi:hypothetical protein